MNFMDKFNIYLISPLAKVEIETLLPVRKFCIDNEVEVYAYTDKVMIVYGIMRTFKYPKNVTANWLQGRVNKVMSDYKKSPEWKILHG